MSPLVLLYYYLIMYPLSPDFLPLYCMCVVPRAVVPDDEHIILRSKGHQAL